jgi:DNA-binding LacI/PurR family transcriptional regulator
MGLDGVILISGARESSLYDPANHIVPIGAVKHTGENSQAEDLQMNRALRDLILSEIPVVSVDCSYGLCGSVVPAYEEGIRALLTTAFRMGHSRICLIYGNGNAGTTIKNEFRRICAELHLTIPVNYLIRVRAESMQDSYEAVTAVLQGARWIRPTCCLFGDDFLLEGGCAALRSRGCRIPEDISVASISCENMSNSMEGMVHALTSWRIRPALIAEEAVRMLLSDILFPGKTSRQTRKIPGHIQLGETISSIWTPGKMYRAPGETV